MIKFTPIELLTQMKDLMLLKGENPFKIRAFDKAIKVLDGRGDLKARAQAGTLVELEGIGKGISEVLTELLLHQRTGALDELTKSLPEGLTELTQVSGLGPKKAMKLIEELGIKSLAELEYACLENRLLTLDGFGEKAQAKILEGVSFLMSVSGKLRRDQALPWIYAISKVLEKNQLRYTLVGEGARGIEVLESLEFLISFKGKKAEQEKLTTNIKNELKKSLKTNTLALQGTQDTPLEGAFEKISEQIQFHFIEDHKFGSEQFRLSSSFDFIEAFSKSLLGKSKDLESFETETEVFSHAKQPYIPAECREFPEVLDLIKKDPKVLESLIATPTELTGVFHNHTTRSDGKASLEEMVREAKKLGYRYIGISEHSETAFYANGLRAKDLVAQQDEIKRVQDRYPEIKIFWGIESDILKDGALDYDLPTLKKFDFVIGSIHQRHSLTAKETTQRVIRAIEHPATKMIGHLTGRILLGRKPMEMDIPQIIEAASARGVALEINANPYRLDIDWRWSKELRKAGTLVSINPDAHDIEGLSDTHFGVMVARKALLPKEQILNTWSFARVEKWLKK